MSTVIYLSNLEVLAVVGTSGHKCVTVRRVCRGRAPEGSIINGIVADEEVFDRFLREFWMENQLPKRGVTLVLGSARAVAKLIQVPGMPHRKLMEYIPRELAGVERTKNPVFTYTKVGKAGNMDRILACMVDRSFLEPHIKRFRFAGIRLHSIILGSTADIMALNHLSYLEHRTFVAQILDGTSVQNILYVDGQYFQMSRSRVLAGRGTAGFGAECARTIGNQQHFLKVQQVDKKITHVYLMGEFDERDFEICRESILQMDGDLQVEYLHDENDLCLEKSLYAGKHLDQKAKGQIRYRAGEESDLFARASAPIGGLFRNRKQNDFLHQYVRGTEGWKRRKALEKLLLPTLAAAIVFSVVTTGQAMQWFYYASEVEKQLSYMSSPSLNHDVAEYDRLDRTVREIKIRQNAIRKTREYLASYPVCSSRINQAVLESAAGLVTAELSEYDGITGTAVIVVSAEQAENIHRFAARLEERKELFRDVSYEGFAWNERSGRWETVVNVHLVSSRDRGKEEAP